jgi:hypothetical protein
MLWCPILGCSQASWSAHKPAESTGDSRLIACFAAYPFFGAALLWIHPNYEIENHGRSSQQANHERRELRKRAESVAGVSGVSGGMNSSTGWHKDRDWNELDHD